MRWLLLTWLTIPLVLEAATGTVHIYRYGFAGPLGKVSRWPIRCDGVEIASLKSGSVITVNIKPGRHEFYGPRKQFGVTLDVKEAEDYYLVLQIMPGLILAKMTLTLVPPEQGVYETQRLSPADAKTEKGVCP